MQPLVELTAEDKEAGSRETVGDHLHHGALQGQLATRVDSDHHKTHVGDAGVGHQPFDVGLGKGHDGAVDDPDQAKHHGVGSKFG